MDPSHYKSEGVPTNHPSPSTQHVTTTTTTHASSNLPAQRPIYTSENGQKKNVPVAAIKPVVKPQQQKPPSRVQNWNQWKTPSNTNDVNKQLIDEDNEVFRPNIKVVYATDDGHENMEEQQELFNRNYVTTNAVENVLRRTSLTKKLDADMFRNRTRLYPRSPNQIDQEFKEPDPDNITTESPQQQHQPPPPPHHHHHSVTSKLETDAAQRPKKRRSIPPPPTAQRRSQSYSDLTADSVANVAPQSPPIVPMRHQSASDKKIMQDAVQKFVINKKGRRSFDNKQASLERQTSSKLIEDISSSSNGSTSPDRNIRQRTEVLPVENAGSAAASSTAMNTTTTSPTSMAAQFSPLNPRPYIRSNLATARLKPLKDRSASQPSLHNTRNQTRLTTTSNVEPKTDHTRNRQPIIVPNDDYENNNTSSSSPEVQQKTQQHQQQPISYHNQVTKNKQILQYGQNRSPSPQHTLNTGNEFFPSNPHVPTVGPTVRYRNHSERKERPVSCRYPSEFERNYFANRQESQALSRSEENMLAPYRQKPVSRPASALGAPMGRSMEQLTAGPPVQHQVQPTRHRLSRPLSQELERLAEFIEEDHETPRRSSTNSRPSVSELVSQLDNVSITTPDRSVTPRPSSSQTPLSSASRSNSIQQTLHSISEQPNNDQTSTVASEKQRVYRQRSDELVRKPRETAAEVSLSRKESMNSSSSSVGYDANFPPPPSSAYEEEQVQDDEEEEEVPDDIKITMQKIRHSSRDPTPPTRASPPPASTIPSSHQSPPPQQQPTQVSEPEIELIPEPATDKLPDAYFQPNFIADLRLNMRDDNPSDGQDSSSSADGVNSLSDKQQMIATHEEAVIAFTTDREELIKESRQNELYGEQIIQIIKSKCPSILGKLQPFVEDIQSNYKLTVQLTGRITRAEAARAEAEQLDCVKTREVCEQKIKALRAQQLEADRLNSHCQERESRVLDCLKQHLSRDEFITFDRYISLKRSILKEQYMIEERIKGAELLLRQLKET